MCRGGTLQSAECHPCTLVSECHPGTSDSLRNFTPVVHKVSSQDFLRILGNPQPKITNRFFDRRATKTWVRSFWGATMGQIFEILTWRNFGPLRQWSRKFPSRIFHSFWAPHSQKLQIGLSDRRATKRCFSLACDQNLGSVLLTVVRLFPYLGTFNQWCDNWGVGGGLSFPNDFRGIKFVTFFIRVQFWNFLCQLKFWVYIWFAAKFNRGDR